MKFNGKKLKLLLVEKNTKLISVTKGIGLTKHTLSRWVNGVNAPEVGEVMSILNFLGYSESEAKEVFWTLYN